MIRSSCRVLIMLLTSAVLPLSGQITGITGTIFDASQAAVPAASVKVVNVATGVERTGSSTAAGVYEITALQPGTYTVTVSKEGFEAARRENVLLTVATLTRLDWTLTVGSSAQALTVTEDASLLRTDTPESATTVSTQQYNELPLVQQGRIRSPAAFVYLAPGVQGNITAAGAENTAATNQFVVNGSQMQVTEFYVEGLAAGQMRTVGSYNESAPPVDAIREFKLTTTLVPADYGHGGAAAGTFSIKSGTNEVHGTAYEYFRNSKLDARPWGTVTPAVTHQNEFGATIGGPVLLPKLYDGRDRSFFFFSYGGSRKAGVDALQTLQVPTAAQLAGNFSGTARVIYDPVTTRLNDAGTGYVRTPLPGNIIPKERIDPVAARMLANYPSPNRTGALNYAAYKGEKLLNPDAFTIKGDHMINSRHLLSASLVTTNIPRLRIDTALPGLLASGLNQTVSARTARGTYDWIPASDKINSLFIGYNRFSNFIVPLNGLPEGAEPFGVPGLNSAISPAFTFTDGYATVSSNSAQYLVENTFQIKDVFSWSVGAHRLRAGGELRQVQFNDLNPSQTLASLGFSNLGTGNPGVSNTGDAFASFLLGQVNSASKTLPLAGYTRRKIAGMFLHDDWKATRRLTVNAGLRFEFQTAPVDKRDRSSIVSLGTPNPAAGGRPGALIFAGVGDGLAGRSALASTDYSAISPRIGLAYQIGKLTVLRAGYGMYYSDYGLSIQTSGFQPEAGYASPNNGVSPSFVLSNGFPQATTLDPVRTPGLLNGQSGTYIGANAGAMPRIQEWTFGIQHMLASRWLVEASYIGNHGTRLIDSQMVNINQVDPAYLALGSVLTQPVTSAAAAAAGIRAPYPGFTGSVAQALRPYPQYLTLTSMAAKAGKSNYHAMQLVVRKRFGSGLSLDANYTWSKNLGYSSPSTLGGGIVNNVLQNSFDSRSEYSILPLDVPHAVVVNWTYELPFGKGRRFVQTGAVANAVIGGWRISAIHRYQSGYPLPIVATNNLPIFNRVLRPDVVSGVDRASGIEVGDFNPATDSVINKAAFRQPAAFQFGTAAPTYSDLRNFPVLSEDLAITKSIAFTERVGMQLYGQAFNVLNRHRFTQIQTNFNNNAFGAPASVSTPRIVQIGARVRF